MFGACCLVLGNFAPELVERTSESLAGRVVFVKLGGFHLSEVDVERYPLGEGATALPLAEIASLAG